MARTINEIKAEITASFIQDQRIQDRYGLDIEKTFEQQFSKASLESILFFIVAAFGWLMENTFETHTAEIDEALDARMTHNRRWYRDMTLRFQFPNRDLIPDTDHFDNTGLTPDEIANLEVIKFAAVTDNLSELRVKVAKGEPGSREMLSSYEETALAFYLSEIRDAGVKVKVVNQQADRIFADLFVLYNPMLLNPNNSIVENAVSTYVSTLEFDGLLSDNGLMQHLLSIQGIERVDFRSIETQRADNNRMPLGIQQIAESGYWIVKEKEDVIVKYEVFTAKNF